MTEINLIEEATKFMLLGMGIVFIFLYVLVQVMRLQHKIIHKYFPEAPTVATPPKKSSSNKAKKIAAISAAIQYHESKGK
jgi:oxaloacetate decarboxylase gamma subunit